MNDISRKYLLYTPKVFVGSIIIWAWYWYEPRFGLVLKWGPCQGKNRKLRQWCSLIVSDKSRSSIYHYARRYSGTPWAYILTNPTHHFSSQRLYACEIFRELMPNIRHIYSCSPHKRNLYKKICVLDVLSMKIQQQKKKILKFFFLKLKKSSIDPWVVMSRGC